MPTRSALTLVDTVAQETAGGAQKTGAGAQSAAIRALVDEVERHHPSDRRLAPLREQLGDELAELSQILEGSSLAREGDVSETSPLEVLLVDDDPAALRVTKTVLESLGYPCRTATNGAEALRAFDDKPAPIVLSDWCMPEMTGLELCVALKRREPRPYVILVTAFQENARLLDGVAGGADDFLHKPVQLDELEVRLIAGSRLLRAVQRIAALRDRLRLRDENRNKSNKS